MARCAFSVPDAFDGRRVRVPRILASRSWDVPALAGSSGRSGSRVAVESVGVALVSTLTSPLLYPRAARISVKRQKRFGLYPPDPSFGTDPGGLSTAVDDRREN